MTNILEIRNLSKSFRIHRLERTIRGCRNVDISIGPGEFVGITGRSGSGKSTILKLAYRTYRPETGSILYNSLAYGPLDMLQAQERQVIHLRRWEIGYVSQFLHVVPRTGALQIVENSALETGTPEHEVRDVAQAMLRHFELDESLWDTYPQTFSGGEKLRLNIARAMVKNPRLLLLDEPTASLDNHSKQLVGQLLRKLKEGGTTIMGIFHDLDFMEGLCDRTYDMETGEIGAFHAR
jgi:alpha-D-ribose 1-methylphosphonate 5-triphosphate synthase subunit PhnL